MVQIENRPALEVIRRFNHEGVFMYIDPPYLMRTRSGKPRTEVVWMNYSDGQMTLFDTFPEVMA